MFLSGLVLTLDTPSGNVKYSNIHNRFFKSELSCRSRNVDVLEQAC